MKMNKSKKKNQYVGKFNGKLAMRRDEAKANIYTKSDDAMMNDGTAAGLTIFLFFIVSPKYSMLSSC